MKLEIADIATNEKKKLNGFRVLGIFPFHLKYISTGTHIQLCKLRAQIQLASKEQEPKANDFFDAELQAAVTPLVNKYVVTALLNGRMFGFLIKPFLQYKIKRCSHYHLLNLYVTIYKLDEPAFFLTYWKLMNQVDNTLLKEAKPS
jgi:hypothetical protein